VVGRGGGGKVRRWHLEVQAEGAKSIFGLSIEKKEILWRGRVKKGTVEKVGRERERASREKGPITGEGEEKIMRIGKE